MQLRPTLVALLIAIGNLSATGSRSDEQFVPNVAVATYLEAFGSLSLVSLHLETGIDNPFHSSVVRSFRASAGFGLLLFTGVFAPFRLKAILGGEDALELGGGVLWQWTPSTVEGFYDWSDAPFSPTFLVGYRYEPYDGGIMFRASLDGAMDPGTNRWFPSVGISIGYSF